MPLIRVFEAREDLDKTEGRGGSRILGYFLKREAAEKAAEEMGPMGTPGSIQERWVVSEDGGLTGFLVGYGTVPEPVEIVSDATKAIRRQALAKLSDAERAALGWPNAKSLF